MAGGHGGSRTPANPAPVSGPGALSRRTDGKQPIRVQNDQDYGDRKTAIAAQQAAPLKQQGEAPPMQVPQGQPAPTPSQGQAPAPSGVPFGAPTQRPDEPITTGVDIGPGAGSSIMGFPQAPNPAQGTGQMTALLANLSASDTTGILGQLYQAAQARGA